MEKRKRKELTLQEKVKLIGESNGKVQTILKRKAEIMEGFENNAGNDRKRLCKRSPVEEVNILMWEWFQNVIKQGVRVSGPMLQEKALIYAKELGISEDDFKASKGWLNRFRDRHNISFQTGCGESGSVSSETIEQWKSKLPDIVKDYDKRDIYNMDETGLYFRALSDKTLCVRGDEFKGGKRSKDRLTVMLCTNMNGDFEKPLVIGKARVPRCFRNLQVSDLPVTWKWNKKSLDDFRNIHRVN
ncbi:tigger transposable element-derived protein 6-like [Mercenaria mercenaria]|uniref:tigger transposable element-derived protein 6-like n=1 Tax=Mercenaria mercenaria TaxID=6596 RepID=UPI00234F6EDF|nr:tigger transposable element-derived protein 6-like [Mercenaria mercenaria]